MTKPENRGQNPEQKKVLSDEMIEETKRTIIFGTGYKRPPEHTRFKKGQSGNPKGRPRSLPPPSSGTPSTNDLVLREAKRLITIKEGDEVYQVSTITAVHRAQTRDALNGSAYAQKHQIANYNRAERERRLEIAEQIEIWEKYIEQKRQDIADAVAKGETPPTPLPHPDDVVLDRESGVRFQGPIDKEAMERLQQLLRHRDILLMQDAWDERSGSFPKSEDPLDGPGTAMIWASEINNRVPLRFRLSETEISIRMMRFLGIPKRTLLKDLYRSWKNHGHPLRRGFTFPPLRAARAISETAPTLFNLALSVIDGEIEQREYEARFVEVFSEMQSQLRKEGSSATESR